MVAGIAARCFAAGECKLGDSTGGGGIGNMRRILQAAWDKRLGDDEYAWNTGDGLTGLLPGTTMRVYYGPLAWAGKW